MRNLNDASHFMISTIYIETRLRKCQQTKVEDEKKGEKYDCNLKKKVSWVDGGKRWKEKSSTVTESWELIGRI